MGDGKTSRAGILVAVVLIGAAVGKLGLPVWSAVLEVLRNSPWQRGYHHPAANGIVNNLRIIEGAKDQWDLEHCKPRGQQASLAELAPYLKGGTLIPVMGEMYFPHPVGTSATARFTVAFGTYKAGSVITAP